MTNTQHTPMTVEESVWRMHPILGALAGSLLTMQDGSVWWHPYNGAAPIQEAQATGRQSIKLAR
jgi:hypothetical protein